MKDLCSESFEMLERVRKPGSPPRLIEQRIGVVEMAILPKATNKSSAIPTRVPGPFFTDIEKVILNCLWKRKD